MNQELLEKIRQCPTLPSLPAIALQVLELAQQDQVDLGEIARVISKDPALSGKILRTVNSSFYGRSQSISTISHALVILGLQSVKTLVLGFSLVGNLSKNKAKGFDHMTYWRRSIYSATAARLLAVKLQIVQQEECFLVALLQDLGMLVLDQVLGNEYGIIIEKVVSHGQLAAAETAAIGMTHAEVAGCLAEMWKLPPLLATPICQHHSPEQVSDPVLRRQTDVACVAGRAADVFVDEEAAPAIADVRKMAADRFSMDQAECDALLDEIGKNTREVAKLFEISISASANFESILKKANEALVDLTLRSQKHAQDLVEQNRRLKEQASTDALTALANRASFDLFLAERFQEAVACGEPLSLLLMDVDHFKKVNDTYGHQTGDAVLKAIGALLKSAARAQDLAARYGGEEMALVLPKTARTTAIAIAESVRRAISARPVAHAGRQLNITASIGVATWEPGSPLKLAQLLLKASDMAVYAAKKSGRNCVRIFSLAQSQKPAA